MNFIYLEDWLKEQDIIINDKERAWLNELQRNLEDLERYTMLYALCKYKGCKSALEIGSGSGWGCDAMRKAGARVTGIDINPKNECNKPNYKILKGQSKEILPKLGKFDLVFVDGNHDYPYVLFDLIWANQNAKKYMIVHDYNLEKGVTKGINELFGEPKRIIMDIKKSKKPYNYGIILYEKN